MCVSKGEGLAVTLVSHGCGRPGGRGALVVWSTKTKFFFSDFRSDKIYSTTPGDISVCDIQQDDQKPLDYTSLWYG